MERVTGQLDIAPPVHRGKEPQSAFSLNTARRTRSIWQPQYLACSVPTSVCSNFRYSIRFSTLREDQSSRVDFFHNYFYFSKFSSKSLVNLPATLRFFQLRSFDTLEIGYGEWRKRGGVAMLRF